MMFNKKVLLGLSVLVITLLVGTQFLLRRSHITDASSLPAETPAQPTRKNTTARTAGIERGARLNTAAGIAAAPATGTAANTRNAVAHRPDEPMSPDEFTPDPLKAMGENLRDHPTDIAALFEQLKSETDPEKIKLLTRLIAENAAQAGFEIPTADVIQLANSDNATMRQAAMVLLGTMTEVTPDMVRSVAGISRNDVDKDVRVLAIKAMGEWMDHEYTMREELSKELIAARDATSNAEIRGYAIQTIGLQKDGVPASLVESIADSLRRERLPENRSLAALALSHAEPQARPQALQSLQQAYGAEPDLDARRHLITMMMRTAGPENATQVLQQLQPTEPQLRQDIQDYTEIIAAGETDVNRIYELKNQRDGDRGTEPDLAD